MPASDEEIEAAENEGVKFNFLMTPIKILAKDGRVRGVECLKMELGEPDESGRRRPVPVKGSEFTIDTTLIIPAIGQSPELPVMTGKDKVEITNWGTIKADPVNYKTNVDGVFAGGDCVTGPATLIEALDVGNKVARSIDCYLKGESLSEQISFDGMNIGEQREDGFIAGKEAEKVRLLNVDKRCESFAEVESGYGIHEAIHEAQRCLRCYRLMVWERAE
jgi:NADPH-dependent glutamate synthase beta chain and related oxidoreductases